MASVILDEIIFTHQEDAERVLEKMRLDILAANEVRVYDYYEAAGAPAREKDKEYGWIDLTGVIVQPTMKTHYIVSGLQEVEMGYIITLPMPVKLI